MDRRNFLKNSAVGAALSASLASSNLIAATDKRELRMATSWPKNFPGLGTGAERVAKRIGDLSGGNFKVKTFASGELVSPLEVMDAVSSGSAHLGHTSSYYAIGKSPAFNFFATVPFGMTANEHYAWIRYGGGQELWDEISAKFGVKPLLVGNTGPQMGGWFIKEIKTINDLKGKRLRFPGWGGELLRKLGAIPVTMPGGELFTALQSGTLDGVEWIAPWNDMAFGLQKICKHYYYPGFHEPAHGIALYVNLKMWNKLSAQEKAIIEASAEVENATMLGEYNAHNQAALESLLKDHGVQLHQWPEEIVDRLNGMISGVISKDVKKDSFSKKVYASWKNFMEDQKNWADVGVIPYLKLRQDK